MTRAAALLLAAAMLGGCAKSGTPTSELAARIDAGLLLAAFVPPAGAVALPGIPAALTGTGWTSGDALSGQVVEALGWWQVKGDPHAVIAPIMATPPPGSQLVGQSADRGGVTGVVFIWPDDGFLRDRTLNIGTAALGSDTVIRVAALVYYANPRPAAAEIGGNAKVAVVSLQLRAGGGPDPVTVTDRAKVAKLAAIINAAQPEVLSVRSCGKALTTRPGLTIVFRTTVTGPDVATAVMHADGCGGITVTTTDLPDGIWLEGGPEQINEIVDILGVRWPTF